MFESYEVTVLPSTSPTLSDIYETTGKILIDSTITGNLKKQLLTTEKAEFISTQAEEEEEEESTFEVTTEDITDGTENEFEVTTENEETASKLSTEIIYTPMDTPYHQEKLILLLTSIIFILMLIILFLVIYILKRNQSRNSSQENEIEMRTISNTI